MRYKEIFQAMKMKKHNIPEEVIRQFETVMPYVDSWPVSATNPNPEKRVAANKKFYELMDKHLTEEQRLLLYEYGGSCRGGETGRQSKLLKDQIAGMSIADKIQQMNTNPYMYRTRLNEDGTITATCCCHCLQYRKNPDTWHCSVLPYHYGCAAGAALYNLKKALDVKARIKSIDYPQNDDGKMEMTFTFEILE